MERVRTLTRRVVVAAALAAVAPAAGCVTTQKFEAMQQVVSDAVAPAKPVAATEFACAWQNRLATLPDPTKGGMQIPGVVGQVFLYTPAPDYKPAEVLGDLTITIHDTTPRPPGYPQAQPEAWHFTRDVLKKLKVADERFGPSLAVFLPWPENWKDVNRLYIQSRYDQSGGHPLFAQPATVTLDFSSPGGGSPNMVAMPPVPDPSMFVKQARAAKLPKAPPPDNRFTPGPTGGVGTVSYPPNMGAGQMNSPPAMAPGMTPFPPATGAGVVGYPPQQYQPPVQQQPAAHVQQTTNRSPNPAGFMPMPPPGTVQQAGFLPPTNPSPPAFSPNELVMPRGN